jgi:DNA topoisomerase-1
MNLLVLESPAKCSKIQGFLGQGWRVVATMGHIRALKEGLDGIGFGQGWKPTYEVLTEKAKAIKALKDAAKGAKVFLGSDDDREGEAISWHVCQVLGLPVETTPRVIFHEITKEALVKAVAKPTRLDMDKVRAQQGRAMLDMLIGFTLSPCLWKGVGYKPGLSAGRCQTPALRLVYDRDRLIESHEAKKTWTLSAMVGELKWVSPVSFEQEPLVKDISTDPYLSISDRKDSVSTHQAPDVFITSTLQQEASSRLRMNPKVTMRVAQTLYEQGHITYMRTDCAVLSQEASQKARGLVETKWGADYLGPVSDAVASGAHEGIRPTHLETDSLGDGDEARLYSLIWKRTMQSVMSDHKEAVVRLKGTISKTEFFTESRETTFAGWRIIGLPESTEEGEAEAEAIDVASLKPGKKLKWTLLQAKETLTSPASRYTEASLIRELEKKGIGRPSTYATLIETVLERGYVEKAKATKETTPIKVVTVTPGGPVKTTTETLKAPNQAGKLITTALGRTVIEWLLSQFSGLIDYGFTGSMEAWLDEVAEGTKQPNMVLDDVWTSYREKYDEVMKGPGKTQEGGSKGSLGSGYKILVTKKGPLFVHEADGVTAFAPVPPSLSVAKATLADAKAAFAASSQGKQGVVLGTLDGQEVLKKTGKFGDYVTWLSPTGEKKTPYKSESFEDLCTKLKTDTIDHTIGPFKIKKGPYGLYMYRISSNGKKPDFVSLPPETEWSTLTVEGAEQIYKHFKEAKTSKTKTSKTKDPLGTPVGPKGPVK